MNKIKKSLAFLLSLLMLMTALPLAVIPTSAADTSDKAVLTGGEETHSGHTDWTAIDTADKLAALFANGGKGYLTSDITVSNILTSSNKDITLCLNGYVIDLNGKYMNPIGGSFTLYDCNSTNQTHKFKKAEKGAAQALDENGEYAYPCGVITNGGSGAIILGIPGDEETHEYSACTFVMYGGRIIGNVNGNEYSGTAAGGVYIDKYSSFVMKGGYIAGNYSPAYGGGVYICSYNKTDVPFLMTGGSIINNSISRGNGGGVYIDTETKGYFGGTAVVKDNLCIPENEEEPQRESNVGLNDYGGKIYIADGDNAPVDGMEVGISGYQVNGGKEGDQKYIFADQDPYWNNAFTWENKEYFSGMRFVEAGAKANGHNYANLADAVLAVKNNGTITLLTDAEEGTVTVNRAVTFTVDNGEFTNKATIAAGEGYNLKVKDNTYYIGTHTHTFATEWTTDESAHWHACTAEECDIEDYSSCDIEGAAYAEHTGMGDFVCDVCQYSDTEGKLSAKADAVDAINELVKSTDSDTVKALAAEAKEKIADAATAEEINSIVEEYTDKINYRKLYDGTSAELDASLNSDGYSDEMKAIFADTRAKMENIETYEELREFLEEFREKIELQQAREQLIAKLEDIIECGIYSDKIVEMASNYIDEFKKIDNMDDFEKLLGECDVKLSHQFFKDAACNEVLKLAGKDPSEKVMKIINDAIDEIQGMEETPDFDDIYMDVFNRIIYQAEEDVAQCKAEEKALADAISTAKKDLETAKAEATSKEAKAAIDKAIANVEKATNPDDAASAKSAGITAAANADKTLADTISNFKNTLETAKNDAKSDAAKAVYADAIAALDNAKSLEDVETIVESAEMNAANADKALADAIATAKSDLETAKNNAKSDAAKEVIEHRIDALDGAESLEEVARIKADALSYAADYDRELAEVKATAKEALNTALTNAKSDAAKAALNEAIATVDNATDPDTVAEAKTTGTINAAIADNALASAKDAAKKALETAKAEATSKEAKAAIDKAIANVEKATNPADVALEKLAGTAAAAKADKTLADTITTAKANLETAKNNAKSNAAKAAYTNAIAALDNAKSMEAIETIVEGAEMAAANADKALADAQAEAKETLKTAKENAVSDEAKAAIDKAIANVEKATNPVDVASAKSAGTTAAANADKTLADTISNFKNTLETAKNDAKSDAAKAAYTDAIAALDNAKSLEDVETIVEGAEMNAANADKALADAISTAKSDLEAAKENAKSDAAKAALDEAIANVEKATSPADVASAKSAGTTAAANADKALADAKDAAKSDLAAAKENAKSDAAKAAIEKAEKAIDEATNPADVASEKATAETAAAEADKALADAQAEAVEALEAAKEKAVSDEAKAAIDEAIADAEKATNLTDTAAAKADGLNNAKSADEALAEAIKNAKADLETAKAEAASDEAKAAIDEAIKALDSTTSLAAVADKKAAAEEAAQAADKELADAKAEAVKAVEALAGEDATDEVKQLVEDAKEAINAATSPEAVDTAEDNGLAAVEHKQKEEGFTVPDLDIQLGYRETVSVNAISTTNKIIYTSSNEKVVTVDEDGNLKAVGKGKATVTATIEGTDISEEIEIEVNYTFWDSLVWHIRNLLELIASGFKWLLALIGINL